MRIIIIDEIHNILIEKFTNFGYSCEYNPKIKREEILKTIRDFDGLIVRSKTKIDKQILHEAKKLKFIGRVGSGLENIDVKFAEGLNIKCFNSPEGNCNSVAEQAIGMLLSVLNNIVPAFHQIKNGIWQREANRGIELMGKTIGIIGYGNVGSALAKRLSSFGVQVFAYDKYKFGFSDDFAKEKSIDEIFRYADILSLHIPLTQETEYLINDDFLKKFKKKIFLINTSRGKIVKTSDLVGNLKTGKVSGACLDVLEYEKITFEELYNSENQEELKYLTSVENVILSPHIAGLTHESNYKLSEILADKIIEYCKKDKFCV